MMNIAVFYSVGAFGDCARHAILHAIEHPQVGMVKVFSSNLDAMQEENWKCGCPFHHGVRLKESPGYSKIQTYKVDVTKAEEMAKIDLKDVDVVISGLGNRQPFLGERVAKKGITHVLAEMSKNKIGRLIMMTSMGVNEDKPCLEWRWEGKIMAFLFLTFCRREYNDLASAENVVKANESIDYVFVRPVGLGEDVVPVDNYFLQKKKHEDELCPNMAKMDVGKFLVDQAVEPTLHKKAVVIGGDPKDSQIKL